jgi:hypothetical protein
MAAHIGSFDARGLANSAWAFAKLKHTPPGGRLPALIAAAARDKLPGFSAQNLSNLLWAFVYLHHRDEGLLAAASREVVAKVGELKPQELSNVVWALASLEHYDAQLMGVLGRAALAMLPAFKEQELSNVVWAYAKLGHARADAPLFDRLLDAAKQKLPQFQPQVRARGAWRGVCHSRTASANACARMEHTPHHALPASPHLTTPQGVSNIAWALAAAGRHDERLLEALLSHCREHMAAYDVQVGARGNTARVGWSGGTRGSWWWSRVSAAAPGGHGGGVCGASHQPQPAGGVAPATREQKTNHLMLDGPAAGPPKGRRSSVLLLARRSLVTLPCTHRRHTCTHPPHHTTTQGLSNMLWACATLGHHDPAFVAAAARECGVRAERMSAQNLGNVLWACATLGHGDARLLGLWADAAMHKLDMFEPQVCVSECVGGCAPRGGGGARQTDACVARAHTPCAPHHTPPRTPPASARLQGLANAAWGFAKLGARAPALFEGLASAALAKLECFTPQGLAHLAWALAAVGHYHPALMAQLSDAALLQAGRFSPAQCSSLLWACATLRHHHQAAFDALLARLAACDVVDAAAAPQLGPQSVANALWALARLDHAPAAPQHVRALVAAAKRLLPAMAQHELCSAVWALAVLGALDVDTWERFCECAASVQGELRGRVCAVGW